MTAAANPAIPFRAHRSLASSRCLTMTGSSRTIAQKKKTTSIRIRAINAKAAPRIPKAMIDAQRTPGYKASPASWAFPVTSGRPIPWMKL